MELCMEAKALKSSLRRELAVNSSQQQVLLFEDFGVSGEDFEVDDLLDLSCGEFEEGFGKKLEDEDLVSVRVDDVSDLSFSAAGDPDDFLSGELAVPDDDIAELEWVSRFVDDSVPELSLLYPVKRSELGLRPGSDNFPKPVPVKARTKRARATGRAWSLGSNRSSSSPTSSCSSGFSSLTSCLTSGEASVRKPGAKKQRRKKPEAPEGEGGQFGRLCSHCLVQKTPQWRTGPDGPKTLCNACGVRFKSGRLFPEYRPACSPTFSREAHSNSHRKVLEMRKRKAVVVQPESELAMVTMIQSF